MNAGLRLSLIIAASHQHQVTSVLTGDTTQWSVSYIYITVNCILTLTALLNSTKSSSDWPDVMCLVFSPCLCNLTSAQWNVWQTDQCLMMSAHPGPGGQLCTICLLGMSGDVFSVSAVFRPPRPSLQGCPKYRAQAASDPGLQHQGPLQQWLVVMQTSIHSRIYAFYKNLNLSKNEHSLSDIFSTLRIL